MSRTASDRLAVVAPVLAFLLAGPAVAGAAAQGIPAGRLVSSQISVSRDDATLTLELEGGRRLELGIRDGRMRVNGQDRGPAARGEALDRSWRDLLNDIGEVPGDRVLGMLVAWQAPSGGESLDRTLEAALRGGQVPPPPPDAPAAPGEPAEPTPISDSVTKLNTRIQELEGRLHEDDPEGIAAEIRSEIQRELRQNRRERSFWYPFRHVGRGLAGIFAMVATFLVVSGLGFVAVFFGRRYLEAVADVARQATLRSWLVGLAGSFLVLPVFLLGTVALAISIIGIPLLLVWAPLFPVAVVLACVFGYLAVAHAAGESLAERRFQGGEWFRHANSYYYVASGLALLLGLFLASFAVEMAGPWLGFVRGLLRFLAIVMTWAAFTIGFGAVLISRAGTRRVDGSPIAADEVAAGFEEESHV